MIRYRDLSVSWSHRLKYLIRINRILKSGLLIDDNLVEELGKQVASYCGRKYGIAVNSGTSAIFIALKALGIKEGDEVIVPCLGVVPVINPILLIWAKPVFVDVREDYNINPCKIMEHITPHTKAILAVDYTGNVCDFDSLDVIAQTYGLYLIEDSSQAFGALNKGRRAGSFGDISVMSMNAMKILGTIGEAGMILTDDDALAKIMMRMQYNGLIDKVLSDYVSLNFRLNTIQAMVLLSRLNDVDKSLDTRRKLANRYAKYLNKVCICPNGCDSSYFTYNIRVQNRDKLYDKLLEYGVEVQKRDSILLPHQLPNREEYKHLKFPFGDEIAKTSLSLPIHNKLTNSDIETICKIILEFYGFS